MSAKTGRSAPAASLAATPRRRRTPDEARAEILAAAREVLAAGNGGPLSVAEVMSRTTLTRKAFYVHFDDLADLLLQLLLPLRADADAALADWAAADDFAAAGRAALEQAAQTYRTHGALLRAVFWSGGADPAIARVRRGLSERIRAAALEATHRAQPPLADPERTAAALAAMNVHLLIERAPDADDRELVALVDTLAEVWTRVLG